MKALYIPLCLLLMLLFGCQGQDNTNKPDNTNDETTSEETKNGKQDEQKTTDEEQEEQVDLSQFFKPDHSVAYFLGDGNEFATYTEKTTRLNDQYVGTIVDNGGVTMMNIYKIGDDKIEIVYKEPVDMNAQFPDIEEIKAMQPIETYFAAPLEVGTTFGNWKIIETGATLETPYKTFENVIVIEEVDDQYVNRKYFVEGFGEVKTESVMDTDQGEKYTVTSTLEKLTTE
ncbi:hypothetical protein [Ureibacillus terrenus]|uniref:Uncharacterized protein n=1 Tax=Ureibacillus terrenus TaxID=118246 RepID=A0A540V160_9BACL|nr:hypothetical protein [Ureibacillus terrenus]TQE90484.1 hypothetical protein FKZ59_09415 [Ureibacillus terrenus]